jgi:site-specific recombinase XerD
VGWRSSTLTISGTKSKRMQQLPLPASTGEAIAQYLRHGRPQTLNRALFVRHRAPIDKPLSVPAIRNAMTRAFVRCGLRDRFCNTHVLRRTTATRLQRSGASVKEIADLLRHQSLDTASTYARVDLEGLRAVTLPWSGSPS